jgi:hypothetical protein
MAERLELKVGDTFPSLRFARRAPSGQSWPTIVGASTSIWIRQVGSVDPAIEGEGTITLSLLNNVLSGEYEPTASDSSEIGEFEAEIEVRFANGRVATFPGNIGGVARYFRVSVVDDLGDTAAPIVVETAEYYWSEYPGEWFGI